MDGQVSEWPWLICGCGWARCISGRAKPTLAPPYTRPEIQRLKLPPLIKGPPVMPRVWQDRPIINLPPSIPVRAPWASSGVEQRFLVKNKCCSGPANGGIKGQAHKQTSNKPKCVNNQPFKHNHRKQINK